MTNHLLTVICLCPAGLLAALLQGRRERVH